MHSRRIRFKRKLKTCRTDVPFLIPVPSNDAVDAGDHHIMADIEFPAAIEEGSVEIRLYYVGFSVAIRVFLFGFYQILDLIKSEADGYAGATVRELTGFNDPNVTEFSGWVDTLFLLLFFDLTGFVVITV